MRRAQTVLAGTMVLTLLSTSSPLYAQKAEQAAPTPSWQDRQFRQRQAANWLGEFRRLSDEIPTLSPTEASWLRTEIDEEMERSKRRYTRRALAAMDSREYQIRVVKPRVQDIIRLLDALADKGVTTKGEATLWTALAACFIDKEFWQSIDDLIQRTVVTAKINGVESLHFENHVLWAQEFLRDFVVDYLRGEHR